MADQPDYTGSCMIALYPPPETAEKLAVPDGLSAKSMHVTIAYTGDAADVDPKALKAVAKALAARPPFTATISGHARFTGGEQDVIVALVDAPELETLRSDARKALDAAGIAIPSEHGFTAHLSIRYCGQDDADPVGRLAAFPVKFGAVSAVHAKKRTDYPFTDPLAGQAREAYAAGWALSGGPMTETVKAGCTAAVAHATENRDDPGILEVSLHLGKLTGTWAEVFRRREELTARHAAAITAAWRKLAKRLGVRDLITDYRHRLAMGESDGPTKQQKEAAAAALLLWLRQILDDPGYADLASAIAAAMAAAIAEGRTAMLAVAADQAAVLGFDWGKAYDAMRAAVTDAETQGAAGPVTQQIMAAVAAGAGRVLAAMEASGAGDPAIEKALEDEIAAEDGAAALAADTAMSGFWGNGALSLGAAEGILLNWMTASDGRVCPSCQDNEDNGPYYPSDFPSLPDHPRCRCCSSPAEPLPISAFAAFLIPTD
ncbi:MAG TPA: 2'-5' RNA ligase family protein [Streptosporangiaceae bacterium]|nr:2'-5' RNA ligase family protein [Streptosporangiaceae bacterium]